ncbi:MAG: DUF4190 domain-containing protein [Isosphaeraceae bacterium]|nr:DUF4190 domain-containing protein [Isosphaeraceae bacterium]
MSADSNPTQAPSTEPRPASTLFGDDQQPLFDELPTYKSVVPSAVVAPICGGLSVLSFTSLYFVAFSVLAVIFGLLALRKIKRFPERSTGEKLAQAGIGLGVVFMLASLTITGTQWLLRVKSASDFAKQYASLIAAKTPEEILYFHATPEGREGKDAATVMNEMKQSTPNPDFFLSLTKPLQEVQDLVKAKGVPVEFDGIEADGPDGLRVFALARLKFEADGGPKYILLRMNGRTHKGGMAWMVDEFRYPYRSNAGIPADPVVP